MAEHFQEDSRLIPVWFSQVTDPNPQAGRTPT